MLNTKSIISEISYVEQIAYQNQKEMSMLHQELSQMQPIIYEYISKKMGTINELTQLALNYLVQLSQANQENTVLKQSNESLHENIKELSNITQKLQSQIQKFQYEIHMQREELQEVEKRQGILQIERSMMRREMKNMKEKLQQNIENLLTYHGEKYQLQNIWSKRISAIDQKQNKQLNSTMENNPRRNHDEKLKNIQKQVQQLREQSIFLQRKVSQSSVLSAKPIKSILLYNNKVHFSDNKYNQLSNIIVTDTANFDSSVKINRDRKSKNANTLQQQLHQLRFKKCNSLTVEDEQDLVLTDVCREDSSLFQSNKCEIVRVSGNSKTKDANQQLLATLDVFRSVKNNAKTVKIINKLSSKCSISSIHSVKQPDYQQCPNSSKINAHDDFPFLNKLLNKVKHAHDYLYHKIVVDRIQPRRSISRERNKQRIAMRNKASKITKA